MSYKIVKISSYYKNFIVEYYQNNPNIINETYQKQIEHLMYQSNAWADFYSKNLQKLGAETHEIIANAEHLQNRWAKENNCQEKGIQLVMEQLKQYKPQVVWFQDSMTFSGQFINELRKSVPSIKLIIGNTCSPYTNEQLKLFKEYDFITTCSPLFKDIFEKNGLQTLLLYQAFELDILKRINFQRVDKQHELIFIGNIISGKGYHDKRKIFLEKILEKDIKLVFYGNIYNAHSAEVIKKQILYSGVNLLKKIGLSKYFKNNILFKKGSALTSLPRKNNISKKFKTIINDAQHGLDMFQTIFDAKISLNIHGDIAGDYAANMRMFETTGVGTCLLTDWKKNIHELFEPDKEIITFKNIDECIEKTKWLIENPKKRMEIAEAGQKRTLQDHNYLKRAEILNNYILKLLA